MLEAQDRVEELERMLGATCSVPTDFVNPRDSVCVRRANMTNKLIGMLLARPFWTKESLYIVLYGDKPEDEQPDMNAINVNLVFVRKTLAFHGVELKWRSGGWYIEPNDKQRLRAEFAPTARVTAAV